MNGFIKIERRIAEWGWYTDVKTFKLFFHLLLFSNYKEGEFLGVKIGRGQISRSLSSLSKETGLTISEVRTAIKHLVKSGDLTCQSFPEYTLFTVTNYELFQSEHTPLAQTSHAFDTDVASFSQQYNKNNKYNNKNNYNNSREISSDFDENDFFRAAVESTMRKAQKMCEEEKSNG